MVFFPKHIINLKKVTWGKKKTLILPLASLWKIRIPAIKMRVTALLPQPNTVTSAKENRRHNSLVRLIIFIKKIKPHVLLDKGYRSVKHFDNIFSSQT